jgi:hypothetical protein
MACKTVLAMRSFEYYNYSMQASDQLQKDYE